MKTKKTFDCVEMKRRGAERIYNQIANMTLEEQLAFWQNVPNCCESISKC